MGKPYKTQERRHIGHKPLKGEKLDKIYVAVLCVCTHTSLEANPKSGFMGKPYNR
jgi:hypothetical protein